MIQNLTANEVRILKQAGYRGTVAMPAMSIIRGTNAQSSANFTAMFFTAIDQDYRVIAVRERHDVAATDGSVDVRKVADGVAATAGTSVLSSAMPLTGAANTVQKGSLSGTVSNTVVRSGESLVLNASGLLTNLQGESVAVLLESL